MNLKQIKIQSSRMGKSYISLGKSGTITLSKKAAIITAVEDGDFLQLHQDEDNPNDWYISISKEEGPIHLRANKLNGTSFMGNNKGIVNTLKKAINMEYETKGIRIPVGQATELDGVKYYPLITVKLLQNE